jgi:hypothetical protein
MMPGFVSVDATKVHPDDANEDEEPKTCKVGMCAGMRVGMRVGMREELYTALYTATTTAYFTFDTSDITFAAAYYSCHAVAHQPNNTPPTNIKQQETCLQLLTGDMVR